MAAIEVFCRLFGISSNVFSRKEMRILEADLSVRVYEEVKEIFRKQYKDYFRLLKFNIDKENLMLEENFLRLMIEEIVLTGEYTLEGIAQYTNTHIDILYEVITGRNTNPSNKLYRKLAELHRLVKQEIYQEIVKKITEKYLAMIEKNKEDEN